jgi:hypothetical protein
VEVTVEVTVVVVEEGMGVETEEEMEGARVVVTEEGMVVTEEGMVEEMEEDCKRMYMHLDILFLRQRNILHQSSYCFYTLHILDCHCNIPHYPVSIKSGMY